MLSPWLLLNLLSECCHARLFLHRKECAVLRPSPPCSTATARCHSESLRRNAWEGCSSNLFQSSSIQNPVGFCPCRVCRTVSSIVFCEVGDLESAGAVLDQMRLAWNELVWLCFALLCLPADHRAALLHFFHWPLLAAQVPMCFREATLGAAEHELLQLPDQCLCQGEDDALDHFVHRMPWCYFAECFVALGALLQGDVGRRDQFFWWVLLFEGAVAQGAFVGSSEQGCQCSKICPQVSVLLFLSC